ncbi:MAG: 2-oxo acid dehydrogenase subunit E2 [Phycisphaerae bacterium]|nr:2-oxo acid dehydrogenase subunit E2 [Phycisphaerae bacterium]
MNTLRVPQANKTMTEVTVETWHVAEGDKLEKSQQIAELRAADAEVTLQAGCKGVLRAILAPEGTALPVGAPLAVVAGAKDDIDDAVAALRDELAGNTPPAAPKTDTPAGAEAAEPQAANVEDKADPPKQTSQPASDATPPSGGSPADASGGNAANVTPVLMPQVGNTMEEGTIVAWRVAEGDTVAAGQIIFDVETDKATVEVEATDAGRLAKIVAAEGDLIPVKQPVAYLADDDADVAAYLQAQGAEPAQDAPAGPQTDAGGASEPDAGDVTPVLMPQVGNTMEEGTIVAWRVAEGDTITTGQIIFDVETDKATVEVEATDAGRLAKIVAAEGDVIPVKQPVAYLADDDAAVAAYLEAHKPEAPPAAPATQPHAAPKPTARRGQPAQTTAGGRVKASPAARNLARERGVDLASVGTGSGPGGRIVTDDVAAAAASGTTVAGGEPVRHELTKMRKAIGGALLKSKQTIPHFYATITVDADALYAAYMQIKADGAFKCTINDFVVRAAVRCMQEFPQLRSRLEGDALVEYPSANIGIAVGTDEGLLVPVVRSADTMSLEQLAGETRRVVEAARGGKLEGVGDGLMTVTNLGMFGVETFGAIINPPESAILAVGALREDAVVRDGTIRPGRVMGLTLSCDHRIVDGVAAAQTLARIKELLEAPDELTD